MTTQEILDLAAAGLAFVNARAERLRLKRERNEMQCERTRGAIPACFRAMRGAYDGGDVETWCETCQKRQTVHLAYRRAASKSGAALRRLMRLAAVGERGASQCGN